MATTTTQVLSPLMKVYYERKLLEVARPIMVADQFADKSRDIPQHEGQIIRFTRYVPLERVVTPINEGENPTPVPLQAISFEASVKKYANSVRLTEEVQLMAFDDTLNAAVEELGHNMGQTLNYLYREAMTRFYPLRADNSNTYAKTYAVSGTSSGTSIVIPGATENDDFWNNGLVVFIDGPNKGFSARTLGWSASNKVLTIDTPMPTAPNNGDRVRVVVTTGLTTSRITCETVERAVALLKQFGAPKFQGRWYIGIISPFVTYDFMQDDKWVGVVQYADAEQIFEGELGMWGGVRWIEDTDPWREYPSNSTNPPGGIGVYHPAGTIWSTPIFGMHAYAGVNIRGVNDKLIVKKPGPGDTSNPINAYSTVSWRVYFTAVTLNALFGVNILSGATEIA